MDLEPTSPPPPGEEPSRGEQLYTYRIRSLTAMCVDDDFSVRMAQRVLQLERINAALRRDTEAERAQSKKFQEEVMKNFDGHQCYFLQNGRGCRDGVIYEKGHHPSIFL